VATAAYGAIAFVVFARTVYWNWMPGVYPEKNWEHIVRNLSHGLPVLAAGAILYGALYLLARGALWAIAGFKEP
jgi:hypothetical protein